MERLYEWFATNPWATALLMVLFIGISTLMVLAILIQRPQGGGLSAAFGGSGGGSGQTAFGTKTGDALTWFTISVFTAFLLFGIVLNYATTPVAHTVQQTSAEAPATGEPVPAPSTGAPADPMSVPTMTPPAPIEAVPLAPASPAPATTPAPSSVPTPAPAPENPAPK